MCNTTDKSFIEKTTILKAEWLKEHLQIDESAVERVNAMQSLVQEARALKAKYKIANKRDLTLYFDKDAKGQSVILENQESIETLAGFTNIVGIEKSDAESMVAAQKILGTVT
jgi:valyl-tRNA synthetase